MTNTFSHTWFETFLYPIADEDTKREVAFVARHVPQPSHVRLLDICCGSGRHSEPLAALGYEITGVDTSAEALERARATSKFLARIRYVQGDMRDLASAGAGFDGAINLWHSFGYYDDEGNRAVLDSVRARLRSGGRFIIDIYNREYHETLPLTESSERGGRRYSTTREWSGKRLNVKLQYEGDDTRDEFEWRLYAPSEFEALAASAGLRTVRSCAWFNDGLPPSPEHARMQFVLEREPA